jgi:chromosomal replication initiation ATPase DnaA
MNTIEVQIQRCEIEQRIMTLVTELRQLTLQRANLNAQFDNAMAELLLNSENTFGLPRPSRPTLSQLVDAAAYGGDVKRELLYADCRPNAVADARKIYYYFGRKYLYTTQEIGSAINRDHTTVLAGEKVMQDLIASRDSRMLRCLSQTAKYLLQLGFEFRADEPCCVKP